jgi:hypothetical protein
MNLITDLINEIYYYVREVNIGHGILNNYCCTLYISSDWTFVFMIVIKLQQVN